MSKRPTKARATAEHPLAPGGSGKQPATDDHKVGYRRPPRHSRFTKGQSGNPKGRPKGSANAKTIVSRVINEKVTLRDGDKARDVTKLEGLLHAHLVKAIKGDARSASLVIGLVARLGLLSEAEPETSNGLSEEDHSILQEYVRRHTTRSEPKHQISLEN
jgi:Family of unknown function (DUF5681)